MLRRTVPFRIPRCVFHVRKLQPQPTPLKSSLGWHVSSLVGSWEAEGRPCQKRVFLTKRAKLTKIQICIVFTESGHQIDENDENNKIDENTLRLAGRGAPPHWCQLQLSAQSLAEVRDASAYCFFSNTSASSASEVRGVTQMTWGRGILSELRELLVEHKFTKAWFNKNLVQRTLITEMRSSKK